MSDFKDRALNSLSIDGSALWEGCILASCVHAVMLAEYPFTLRENRWSGGIYVTQNGRREKAALVFSGDNRLQLGMFCSFGSQRTSLVLSEQYAWSHYKEAPEEIREMAQALSILFIEKAGEKELPFVTTGFWEEDGLILSRDNDEDWSFHGGYILEPQMSPFEEAMSYYEEKCSMDGRRMEIAERLYRERIKSPNEKVVLTREEIEVLTETGPYNIGVCQEVFEQFGVIFEEGN